MSRSARLFRLADETSAAPAKLSLLPLRFVRKDTGMELYRIGSILLDVSIGTMVIGAVIRLMLALTYFKRNGSRTLNEGQRKTLRRIIIPVAVIGLLLAVAACILLLI